MNEDARADTQNDWGPIAFAAWTGAPAESLQSLDTPHVNP